MTQDQHSQEETVRQALRRAFSLGQTYWQQADSEYTSQHRKADETAAKFSELVETTVAHLQQRPLTGTREAIADIVRAHLGDVYHCTRVWSAWGVGTMSQSDFEPAEESTLAEEIADAVLARPLTGREATELHQNHLPDLRYVLMVLGKWHNTRATDDEIAAAMTGLRYIIKRTEEAAASPSLPVRQEPTDEAEFEIHCNGDYEASACGPRAEAWREIQHYAAQYQQDGPVVIYEVTRTQVSASPSVQNMGEGETGKDGVEGRKP